MIYFHPQRGAVVTDKALNPRWRRYRGGADDAWRVVSEPLPKGFLRGDPEKQSFGMGGPELVFGPLEKNCRECEREFVLPAAAQKRLLEDKGAFVDAIGVRCLACTQAKNRLRDLALRYQAALGEASHAPSAKTLLAAARAALALIDGGGSAPIERAIANARKAQRLGAKANATIEALSAARKQKSV